MKISYITDVITGKQYHEIALKFASKEVIQSQVEGLLLKINPDIKEELANEYDGFLEILIDRINEEPFTGLENGILYDEDEE